MEFVQCLTENGFIDSSGVFGHGLQQAGRAQVVNLSGDVAAVVVDQVFDSRFEDLLRTAGTLDLKVDVGGRLLLGQRC